MPNHVQNILTIVGHKNHVEPLLSFIREDDSSISFKKIIPMPEELKGSRAPALVVTEAEYKKWEKEKDLKPPAHPLIENRAPITKKTQRDWLERFGADNWYDWTTAHWGTKWDAYSTEISDVQPLPDKKGYVTVQIQFQTAWSSGAHVIDTLARNYPTIEFYLLYADEDCGSNTGEIWWEQGGMKDDLIPDYSMENYFKCWGGEDGWKQVDDEWVWADDEIDDGCEH